MNARLMTALLACAAMLCACGKNNSYKTGAEPPSQEQIRQLVDQLYSDNDDKAQAASEKLKAIGKPAVEELIKALEDEDGEYWPPEPILDVLAAIGPDAEATLPILMSMDHSSSFFKTIAAIGPRDEHVPELVAWISQTTWAERTGLDEFHEAKKLLVRNLTGAAVEPLIKSSIPGVSEDPAWMILKWLGTEKPSIQEDILKAAASKNDEVRYTAVEVLGRIRHPDENVINAVRHALTDEKSPVQLAAENAIAMFTFRKVLTLAEAIEMLRDVDFTPEEMGSVICAAGESAVPELIKLLDADKKHIRVWAIDLLGQLGKEAMPAVPSLIKALDDEDPEFVCAALYALSETSDTSESTVNAVIHATASQNIYIQKAALRALGAIGSNSPASLAILRDAVNNPDPAIQIDAIYSLARATPDSEETASIIASKIDNEKISLSSAAAYAINRMTVDNSKLTAYLLPVLDSEYVHARLNAIRVLGSRCEPSDKLAAVLCGMFDDDDTEVRENAAALAGKLGDAAIPELKKALVDEIPNRRIYATWALAYMGKQASPAADILIQMLSDKDESIAEWAMVALCEAGVKNGQQVDKLRVVLGSDDANLRRLAIRVLSCAESITDEIVEDVISMMHDKNERVSTTAFTILTSFKDRPQLPVNALVRHMKTDKALRRTIAEILERHEWEPTADIDRAYYYAGRDDVLQLAAMDDAPDGLLAETIRDMDGYAWTRMWQSLKTTQPDAKLVACMAELLADADEHKRLEAAITLGHCGKNAAAAKPQLINALNDESADVKRAAMSSLVAIDPSCEEVIAACLEWINNDKDTDVRSFAAKTLGQTAKLTPPVKAALEKAAKDEDLNVKWAAEHSLRILQQQQDKDANE